MAGHQRKADQVLKEVNCHGVSIARIRKGADGRWALERDPRNRRITGLTPMEIHEPVRGSNLVQTKFSPEGTMTRGTLANCAHGVTPWNTYLAAEENWAGYFRNGDQEDQKPALPREHSRYGVREGQSLYGWELADNGADEFVRFDASSKGASSKVDYRNEPNAFGWIVEIDPFDPESTPVKRTALGRFAHEGVVFGPVAEGRSVVCYSGDDARFEYIYKFVSTESYSAGADGRLLDDGTLFVARFHDDGSGEWLPLVHGQNGLTLENGFASQADVLVNTRTAADFVGATKMDRPEWGAVDPKTGMVYFTLTNNSRRTLAETDAANPRAVNEFGHIIRWRETGDDHTATTFSWDIFVFAGDETHSRDLAGEALTEDNIFSSPDGLWFDRDGRLWIQTDGSEKVQKKGNRKVFGNNQMLAADPASGEIRRFLTGPVGQEITGAVTTPDGKTMFINVQHPGATTTAKDFAAGNLDSHWPDGGNAYPRSATVVITKEDGGVIGT
jgi:secreted PhoX family phosphatase